MAFIIVMSLIVIVALVVIGTAAWSPMTNAIKSFRKKRVEKRTPLGIADLMAERSQARKIGVKEWDDLFKELAWDMPVELGPLAVLERADPHGVQVEAVNTFMYNGQIVSTYRVVRPYIFPLMSQRQVQDIQMRLHKLGEWPGPVDGVLTENFVRFLILYVKRKRRPQDG